jgi:hypothetical protein
MTLLLHCVVAGLVLRAASRESVAFLALLGLAYKADLQKKLAQPLHITSITRNFTHVILLSVSGCAGWPESSNLNPGILQHNSALPVPYSGSYHPHGTG